MDKENKKPEQILWLEKQLGSNFREAKSEFDLYAEEKAGDYILNQNNEIIKLSLYQRFIFNKTKNLSFLSELKSLSHLVLSDNDISDISVISDLKNLTEIYLDGNEISDYYPLLKLKNLTKLVLGDSKIIDYSFLLKLKN